MNRRAALFGALAAALVPAPPAAAVDPWRFKRVFRYTPDGPRAGEFVECAWEDVRPGDRIIGIGITGDRLVDCETFTVKELVSAGPDRPAGEVAFVRDESVNFSDNLHPFYGQKRTDV